MQDLIQINKNFRALIEFVQVIKNYLLGRNQCVIFLIEPLMQLLFNQALQKDQRMQVMWVKFRVEILEKRWYNVVAILVIY